MKKGIFLMAVIFLMSIPMAYADDSVAEGDVSLKVGSLGIVANGSAVANTEAHLASLVVRNESTFKGSINSNVYGSMVVGNAAVGIGSFANLGSVNVKNDSSFEGNISTDTRGAILVNLAAGINSRAHTCSVVVK